MTIAANLRKYLLDADHDVFVVYVSKVLEGSIFS
jgi:hypothetical protein